MKEYLKILKICPLFFKIEDTQLLGVLSCIGAELRNYDKNESILAEGSRIKHIYILLSGTAQIERIDYNGNKNITAHIIPGELFGEAFACMQECELTVHVQATQKCTVLRMEAQRIIHTCQNSCAFHEKLVLNLLNVLASKNLQLHQKAEITAQKTTREKLLTYLAFCAKQSDARSFSVPFDRQGLADYLGVDRSGLSAEISKLRKEGTIECTKNRFKLC